MQELGKSKEFIETQRMMAAMVRAEAVENGFGPEAEPCEFSPPNDPHSIREWPDRGWRCDGYGYLVHPASGAMSDKRCPCWTKWKNRRQAVNYLQTLGVGMRTKIETSDASSRWALGKALERWNFGTPGLLMIGAPGTGKTLAGHTLIAGWADRKSLQPVCIEADAISSDIRAMALPHGDEAHVQAATRRYAFERATKNPGLAVFIDDIGRSRETQAVIDTVCALLRNLYNFQSHCIVATNLTEREITMNYGTDIHRRLFASPSWMRVLRV